MSLGCRGLCENEASALGIKYALGFKRCSICYKKIKTEAVRCYCCNYILRGKVRKSEYKEINKTGD